MRHDTFEPAEVYVASSLQELRALLDRKRVTILRMLGDKPMTVKQLADALGLVPASIHYHVKVLERASLVKLVDKREKSGIVEKYYRAVAREFVIDQSLGRSPDTPCLALDAISRDIAAARGFVAEASEERHMVNAQLVNVALSRSRAAAFAQRLEALAEEFRSGAEDDGETLYSLALAIYPTGPAGRRGGDAAR